MRFSFDCRACSHSNEADWASAGKTVECAGCGLTILVPAPMEAIPRSKDASTAPRSAASLRFACEECGRRYSTRPDLIGKKIRCGGCGAKIRVPDPGSVSASTSNSGQMAQLRESRPLQIVESARSAPREIESRRSSPPKPPTSKPSSSFLDHDEQPPISDQAVRKSSAEPSVSDNGLSLEGPSLPKLRRKKSTPDGEELVDRVLPSRTEKMMEVEQRMAEEAEAKEKLARKRKKKKNLLKSLGRKEVGGGLNMQDVVNILGGSTVAVAVVSLICYQFHDLRFFIGGSLALLGFIVYLLGTAGFSRVAREEGFHFSLMCRFVPFYKWYYLLTRWDEMKGHFVFFCAGLMFLWPGIYIVKISPEWQKADAVKKAYNEKNPDKAARTPPPSFIPSLD